MASFWLVNRQKTPGPLLDLYLDGQPYGKSGMRSDSLVAGSHTLEVRYQNTSKTRRVEIRPDSPLTVNYSVIRQASPAQRRETGAGNVTF